MICTLLRASLLTLAFGHCFAAVAEGCGPVGSRQSVSGTIDLFRKNTAGQTDMCFVHVRSTANRHFQFNSRGDLTVSIGELSGPPVTVCQFRILPTGSVDTGTLNDGTVKSSGVEWRFDSSGNLRGSNGCEYKFEATASEANNCGFTITKCPGRVVLAWKPKTIHNAKERTPESEPAEEASVISPLGAKGCRIGNGQVVNYHRVTVDAAHPLCGGARQDSCTERGSDGQAVVDEIPRNKTGNVLALNLAARCGGDWNFLNGAAINGTSGGSEAAQ